MNARTILGALRNFASEYREMMELGANRPAPRQKASIRCSPGGRGCAGTMALMAAFSPQQVAAACRSRLPGTGRAAADASVAFPAEHFAFDAWFTRDHHYMRVIKRAAPLHRVKALGQDRNRLCME